MSRRTAALLLVLAVVAALVSGIGPASADPLPGVPGTYTSVSPTRLLDTRAGVGASTPAAHGTVHLQVLGAAPVPAGGVSAVVLNITAVTPASGGYVTAWADGAAQPDVSNLNFRPGRTVANLAVVPVGANGRVALYNGSTGATNLLADVAGYYAAGTPVAGGTFMPVAPTRLLDTRSGVGGSSPTPHATVHLQVAGRGGVPDNAAAVVLNLTAARPTAGGFVTAYADTGARPGASNLNFAAGQTVPNLVAVPLGSNGRLALYNGSDGTTPLLADVAGYVLAGGAAVRGAFTPLAPARLLDTRSGAGGTTPGAKGIVHLKVTGRGGVPSTNVTAVVLNLTAVAPTAAGYVTAYADDATRPTASNLNYVPGQTVPNLVVVPVGANGSVALYNGSSGSTPLLADVAGYFLAGPAGFIAGQVTRTGDSAPLGNVGVDVFDLLGNPIATGATGQDGSYRIGGLGASLTGYVVCFDAGAVTGGPYADECHSGRPWDGFSDPPTGVTPVPVVAGATATVDAVLSAAQGVAGTVTAVGGRPLAGVVVHAFDGDGNEVGTATTGPNGTYALTLDTGDYTVCLDAAQASGGPSATGYLGECFPNVPWSGTGLPDGTTPVTVTAGQLRSGVDAVLASAGAVGGRVVAALGGALLSGVTVRAYDDAGELAGTTSTAAGAFTIRNLPAGTYTVCFDGASATGGLSLGGYLAECTDGVVVTAGSLTGADAGLANGGALGGAITAGATGVAGVTITAYDGNGTNVGGARTDSSGAYRIGGLPAGSYTVCADASAATGAPATGWTSRCYGGVLWDPLAGVPALGALAVVVTAALAVPHVDLPLATGAKLTGTVTETGSGNALGDVDVLLVSGGAVVLHATTRSDGTYALPGIPAGLYTVCFDATFASGGVSPTGTYASECFSDRAWDADPGHVPLGVTAVALTAGGTRSGLNAALSDA